MPHSVIPVFGVRLLTASRYRAFRGQRTIKLSGPISSTAAALHRRRYLTQDSLSDSWQVISDDTVLFLLYNVLGDRLYTCVFNSNEKYSIKKSVKRRPPLLDL